MTHENLRNIIRKNCADCVLRKCTILVALICIQLFTDDVDVVSRRSSEQVSSRVWPSTEAWSVLWQYSNYKEFVGLHFLCS